MIKRNAFAIGLSTLMLIAFAYSFWINAAR
jgi:hypothetical protein